MPRGRPKGSKTGATQKSTKTAGAGAALGFEAQLFLAADKPRKNLEPSDYKHVVLGLIFLKQISNAFEPRHAARGQRQLRLGAALHQPPGAHRARRLRARQRLDVVEPVGRGRDEESGALRGDFLEIPA
jgi:hypothetical protein